MPRSSVASWTRLGFIPVARGGPNAAHALDTAAAALAAGEAIGVFPEGRITHDPNKSPGARKHQVPSVSPSSPARRSSRWRWSVPTRSSAASGSWGACSRTSFYRPRVDVVVGAPIDVGALVGHVDDPPPEAVRRAADLVMGELIALVAERPPTRPRARRRRAESRSRNGRVAPGLGTLAGVAAERRLAKYDSMRDFAKSPEPPGKVAGSADGRNRFLVQRHRARRLHYDLRFEVDGVLVSWAVPRGPSLDPARKSLAVKVEDHPYAYGWFEGIIPSGYGMGDVVLWDDGWWEPDPEYPDEPAAAKAIESGEFKFMLVGRKLRGRFVLIRTSKPGEARRPVAADEEEGRHRGARLGSRGLPPIGAQRPHQRGHRRGTPGAAGERRRRTSWPACASCRAPRVWAVPRSRRRSGASPGSPSRSPTSTRC